MAYIYVFGETEDGPVKVGFTTGAIQKRLTAIQMSTYRRLRVLASLHVDDTRVRSIEASMHQLLKDHALRGEWFAVGMTQEQLVLLLAQAETLLESLRLAAEQEADPAVFPEPESAPGDFFGEEAMEHRFTYTSADGDMEIGLTVHDGNFSNALARVRARLEHHLA